MAAGGKAFHYIPCLNERRDWIEALGQLARAHLGNWLEIAPADERELAESAERARAAGAKR
jgi:ferrochelatase